jgi:HSP20 family protein
MDTITRSERDYERIWDAVDDLYGGWLNPEWPATNMLYGRSTGACFPNVDVVREKTNYLLRMELPGLTEKDFNLEVRNGELDISGKIPETEGTDTRVIASERTSGEFCRTFELPDDVDSEHIEASLKNGLLEIKLPIKPGKTTEKHIKVEVH